MMRWDLLSFSILPPCCLSTKRKITGSLAKGPKHTSAGQVALASDRELCPFPPLHGTHTQQPPPRSLWMCVCITARPFKGMQSCQRSKPEETSRTPFVTFHELPECQKAMCGQGWSGDLPNALIRRQDYTVSIKVSHQPWLY